MKVTLTIFFLLITCTLNAQTHKFQPKWEVGTEKTISTVQVKQKFENETLIAYTTIYNETSILVKSETSESYILEVVYKNPALIAAKELYNKLGEELQEYKELVLLFSLNKQTSETELLNWKESKDFMSRSYEQIKKVLEKKAPEIAPMTDLIFDPIIAEFESKEKAESYTLENFSFLLPPFQHEYEISMPISDTNIQENPFSPGQKVSETITTTLKSVEKETGKCMFEQEIDLDLSQIIGVMKNMMLKTTESMMADDEVTKEKIRLIIAFEMTQKNLQTICYNQNTTWVESVLVNGIVTTTDPRDGTKTKTVLTVTTTIE
jgi:hypothetical protein